MGGENKGSESNGWIKSLLSSETILESLQIFVFFTF